MAQPTSQSNERFGYDVFLSYSSQDYSWVCEKLLPRLKRATVRVIDEIGFTIGAPLIMETHTWRAIPLIIAPCQLLLRLQMLVKVEMRDGGCPLVEWVDVGREAEGGGVAGKEIGQHRLWFLSDFLLAM